MIDITNIEKESDDIIFSQEPITEQPAIKTEDLYEVSDYYEDNEDSKTVEVDYIDSLSKVFNPDIKR